MRRTHSRHSTRAGWSGTNTSSMSSCRPSRRSTRPEMKTSGIWCLVLRREIATWTAGCFTGFLADVVYFLRKEPALDRRVQTGYRIPARDRVGARLRDQQRVRMARLREATRVAERALNDKLAKIHESVAAPPFMDAVRRYGRAGHGEIVKDDAVIKSLKSALETVVENANLLRTTMATKLVDLLNSGQAVRFLKAVMQFQLKIRSLGLERDAEKQRELSGGGGGWSPISSRW